jgi:tetratricopeptide (TPR) repeat protein
MLLRLLALFLFVALACTDQIVQAQDAGVARTMNAAQLFHYAEQARGKGDFETAERAYRALLSDTDARIADEARFRLATLLADGLDRPLEAAVLLRQMLDANPDNAGVRLVLARVLGQLGDRDGATRELRAARAVGLPPQVERQVRFFEAALAGQKRSGLSLEVALAPSTNIARATGSDTLDTVLGEFVLSDDAKARSGVGLSARTQGYVRVPVASRLDWRIEASGAATLYRQAAAISRYQACCPTAGMAARPMRCLTASRWTGAFRLDGGRRCDWVGVRSGRITCAMICRI